MKINQFKRNVLAILCIITLTSSSYAQEQPDVITQVQRNKKKSWILESASGFILTFPDTAQEPETMPETTLTISTKSSKLFFNDKQIDADRIEIRGISSELSLDGERYLHPLAVVREKKRIVVIHHRPLVEEKKEEEVQEDALKAAQRASKDFTVRVLLEDNADAKEWKLQSKNGFMIMDPLAPSKKQKIDASELVVQLKGDTISVNDGAAIYTLQAYITPIDGTITFKDKQYLGSMWLLADGITNKVINCLGIEDYVACVLNTESWPGWPLEVNKIFAIASRTYVIAMVQNARMSNRPYHVKNTNKHQTYGGGAISETHKQAVEQTKGVFLTHNAKPITAMFDACCGGIITANMQGVDFKKAPYLARSYPCTFCKKAKGYEWNIEYDINELEEILKNAGVKVRRLRDVKVIKKDKAGVVHQINFKSASGVWHTVPGKKIYLLLKKDVRSFHYTVEKKGRSMVFKGRGYGHHLGLCQWGAKEMVAQGWDYKGVLDFYYPGTQLMRLI